MGNVIVAGGATGIGRAAVRGFRALARKVDHIELTGTPRLRLQPGLRGLSSLPIRLTRRS